MVKSDEERAKFWEERAKEETARAEWYKEELARTQEILGRVIVQYSDRWDKVQLTNFPRKRPT